MIYGNRYEAWVDLNIILGFDILIIDSWYTRGSIVFLVSVWLVVLYGPNTSPDCYQTLL